MLPVMKKRIELIVLWVVPILYMFVAVSDHLGLIDRLDGVAQIELIRENFNASYAPDASRPIYPDNPVWKPFIGLIEHYSRSKIRSDKEPLTIARMVAFESRQTNFGGIDKEWTSPLTPIVVLYQHWPMNTGKTIPSEQYTLVGTLADLGAWIAQKKMTFIF
jgi:hypothetical protein